MTVGQADQVRTHFDRAWFRHPTPGAATLPDLAAETTPAPAAGDDHDSAVADLTFALIPGGITALVGPSLAAGVPSADGAVEVTVGPRSRGCRGVTGSAEVTGSRGDAAVEVTGQSSAFMARSQDPTAWSGPASGEPARFPGQSPDFARAW